MTQWMIIIPMKMQGYSSRHSVEVVPNGLGLLQTQSIYIWWRHLFHRRFSTSPRPRTLLQAPTWKVRMILSWRSEKREWKPGDSRPIALTMAPCPQTADDLDWSRSIWVICFWSWFSLARNRVWSFHSYSFILVELVSLASSKSTNIIMRSNYRWKYVLYLSPGPLLTSL
jgi:hypothetical protein